MKFTYDWVTRYTDSWKEIFSDLIGKPKMRMLEIGAFEGRSAIWWLDNVLTGDGAILDVVDPWCYSNGPKNFSTFMRNIAESGHAGKVNIFRQPSIDYLCRCPYTYDAVYVDGAHEARLVMLDSGLAWRHLRRGGVMLWDDYHWTNDKGNRYLPPKNAIDSFLELYGDQCEVLHHDYQVAVRKTK